MDAHDAFFSFGGRIDEGPFATPHGWRPTRQPVLLSEWSPTPVAREELTTVMSWTSYEPLESRGLILGQKDVELRRLLALPQRSPAPLEIALGSVHHAGWESVNEQSRRGAPHRGPHARGDPGRGRLAGGTRSRRVARRRHTAVHTAPREAS